jgi:hypothetical protein
LALRQKGFNYIPFLALSQIFVLQSSTSVYEKKALTNQAVLYTRD